MMMRNRCRTGLAALMGLSMLAVAARAGEEKISPDELPSAVRKAVKKKFAEAKVRGASKEVEDGRTVYEVELTVEGHAVDVTLSARGKILEVEKEIPASRLPEAVREAVAAKYPGAKIQKAEAITRGEDGPVRYEVVIKGEVVLTARGKFVEADEDDEEHEKPSAKGKGKKKEDKDDDDDDEDEERKVKGKKREKD